MKIKLLLFTKISLLLPLMIWLINGSLFAKSSDVNRFMTYPVFEGPEDRVSRNDIFADVTIHGVVKDKDGQTLPGVTIKVKGGTITAITDINGKYTIRVPGAGTVLLFSYVGYETQEFTVTGTSVTVNITLSDKKNSILNEVVVVGFGTQTKATFIGSAASVSSTDLLQSPVANLSNSLVGRLPGLSAVQGSGEPGQDQSTLYIRGVASFSGNTQPLVLIDGIEVPQFNNIDPNEVESITILKDAASTAIYGIRGANGVILITTKRGKKGDPQIQYTFNQAINSFTALRNEMSAYDFAKSYDQARLNDTYVSGSVFVPKYTASDLAKYQDGSDPIFHPNVNWYKALFKDYSGQQQHNLQISGGTDNTRYFVSAGLFSQDGLFRDTRNVVPGFDSNSDYRRYNFRANFDFNVTKDFKIRFDASNTTENVTGSNNDQNSITNGSRSSGIINMISAANPIDALGIYDNKVVNIVNTANNPFIALLQNGYRRIYNSTLSGSVRLDYDLGHFLKGLSTHGSVNYQNYYSQLINSRKTLVYYQVKQNPDGSVFYVPNTEDDGSFAFSESSAKNRRIVGEFGFDYKRSFGPHTITGLLLYQQTKAYDPSFAYDIPSGYQAVRGRATYNYKGRYLAEFSAAYEGTENFAPGRRFGFFPAYSLGWVPSEEPFFPKNSFVSFLKIRGSYGTVGNDKIGGARFLYNPTAYLLTNPLGGASVSGTSVNGGYYFGVVGSNYTPYPGLVEGTPGNPALTWERAIKRNIGIEMNLWSSKINIVADIFDEKRDNILATPQTLQGIVGYVPPPSNLGKMANKGLDGSITFSDAIGGFRYRIGANYSFARNKIIFQDEVPKPVPYQARTGQRYNQVFGLVADGLFNSWAEVNDPNRPIYALQSNKVQPGDIRFRDINGDGVIDDNDNVPIGYSNIPEKTYGLSLYGSFKGFDLSVLFQGTGNVSLVYSRRFISGFFDSSVSGAVDYLTESWTPDRYAQGLPILFPRFAVGSDVQKINYQTSTYFTADASYLRIKNVELGYTLNAGFLKKVGCKSARFYTNANNLYTWANVYPGVDPESPSLNGNNEPYPLTRTINFGVNVKF